MYSLARFVTYRFLDMVDSRNIHLLLCLPGILFKSVFLWRIYKFYCQLWIWHLFIRRWVVYLRESSFTNVGNDLRIYLTHVDQLQRRTVIF